MPAPVVRALLAVWLAAVACVPFAGAQTPSSDPRIAKLIGQISDGRIKAILEKLGSFETRNTLSSTDSPTKGIGAARQWILDEMTKSSSRLQVSFDSYQAPAGGRITREVELRNVMAVLPGLSIDDYVFGVAAIGADGNESLVAAYVNPPRAR